MTAFVSLSQKLFIHSYDVRLFFFFFGFLTTVALCLDYFGLIPQN